MMRGLEHARILMYSHDTFGLGHLRRCRTIAHSLVENFKGSARPDHLGLDDRRRLRLSRARVDFVKIPSVIKLHNGEYTSIDRHIDSHETLEMRQSIIRHTAETFQPDIFIVDKEPLGLRGELEETLVLSQDPRHHAGAGPAGGDGCAAPARRRMGAARRAAQDRGALRHDLGLRPGGFL